MTLLPRRLSSLFFVAFFSLGSASIAQTRCAELHEVQARPGDPRDWLASGVTAGLPLPTATRSPRAAALLDALRVRAGTLRGRTPTRGSFAQIAPREIGHAPQVPGGPAAPRWRSSCREEVGAAYDVRGSAHRMVAIIEYATAVHLAREHHLLGNALWYALDRLQEEENAPLVGDALRHQLLVEYRPGSFNQRTPGLSLLEYGPRFAPGLTLDFQVVGSRGA